MITPEHLLRSTFAFNSDLGESFMVLDTKGQRHMTSSSTHQVSGKGTGLNSHALNNSHRDPLRKQYTPTSGPRSNSTKNPRVEATHLQHTRSEIEIELNNPLVQSYLSTHAPSPLARSHFDFEHLSQSTISTFNKDTIDNTEGVLNLLQTVRRIGTTIAISTYYCAD